MTDIQRTEEMLDEFERRQLQNALQRQPRLGTLGRTIKQRLAPPDLINLRLTRVAYTTEGILWNMTDPLNGDLYELYVRPGPKKEAP